jgi:hypothetical protein
MYNDGNLIRRDHAQEQYNLASTVQLRVLVLDFGLRRQESGHIPSQRVRAFNDMRISLVARLEERRTRLETAARAVSSMWFGSAIVSSRRILVNTLAMIRETRDEKSLIHSYSRIEAKLIFASERGQDIDRKLGTGQNRRLWANHASGSGHGHEFTRHCFRWLEGAYPSESQKACDPRP